jgi:hypothetical protein
MLMESEPAIWWPIATLGGSVGIFFVVGVIAYHQLGSSGTTSKEIIDLEQQIPVPELATHATDLKSALWSLDKGYLMMLEEGVPLSFSLNRHVWYKPELFVFNLGSMIKEYVMGPVVYLFTKSWSIYPHDPEFHVYSWDFFPYAEILSWNNVSLRKHLKYIVPKSREVRSKAKELGYTIRESVEKTAFSKIIDYWHKQLTNFLEQLINKPPPPHFAKFIHNYNKMVCDIFGLDYERVKREAKEQALMDPYYFGPIWW